MRTYAVTLQSVANPEIRVTHYLLAPWYDTAESDSIAWAARHHAQFAPWIVIRNEVSS